jgi:hypothetical protein
VLNVTADLSWALEISKFLLLILAVNPLGDVSCAVYVKVLLLVPRGLRNENVPEVLARGVLDVYFLVM